MTIIPGINCQELDQVREQFHIAHEILFGAGSEHRVTPDSEQWVHLDVADGSFTNGYSTWRSVNEFAAIKRDPRLKLEVHLMVSSPDAVVGEWLAVGAQRIIFHLETTSNVGVLAGVCSQFGAQAMIAIKPETPVAHVVPYLELVPACQILAVVPGLSGQVMQSEAPQKVRELKKIKPEILVEVDGGVTPATAKQCLEAGADQIVSSSYIFSDDNPAAAYARLKDVEMGNAEA